MRLWLRSAPALLAMALAAGAPAQTADPDNPPASSVSIPPAPYPLEHSLPPPDPNAPPGPTTPEGFRSATLPASASVARAQRAASAPAATTAPPLPVRAVGPLPGAAAPGVLPRLTIAPAPPGGAAAGPTGIAVRSIALPGPEPADTRTLTSPQVSGAVSPAAGGNLEVPTRMVSISEFEQSFTSRYDVKEMRLDLTEGPDGLSGTFSVQGTLTPPAATAPDVVSAGPSAVARAFLSEHVTAVGIARPEDLFEAASDTTPLGWTAVTYHRQVGALELEGEIVRVSIDPNGDVRTFSGTLVPLPGALFAAAAQPTLDANAARAVAAADLATEGADPTQLMRFHKRAVSTPPFVVWDVVTQPWEYRVDAFSGEILRKQPSWRTAR